MSVLRLLDGNGYIANGEILFDVDGEIKDLTKIPLEQMQQIRGNRISVIFQEPMTSLNPVFTVKKQLSEPFIIHQGMDKKQAAEEALKMLEAVQIPNPEAVLRQYPHQLSGGMRQRVMIAMALACRPKILIADEPTTALDVTIQAQILDLLRDLKTKINGSIMLITHDLGVIAEMADYVVVMYAGKVIERGTVSEIFHDPRHPYTIGLQKSKPTMNSDSDTLFNIPGNVPNPVNMPSHCYFKERCDRCTEKCSGDYPHMVQVSPTHYVACHLYGKEGE
jgi:peptide/nickel transport system ATP-binding protein